MLDLVLFSCHADKQTFPQQDVVGWYATGSEITDVDMHIQRKVICCRTSGSPAFLFFDLGKEISC